MLEKLDLAPNSRRLRKRHQELAGEGISQRGFRFAASWRPAAACLEPNFGDAAQFKVGEDRGDRI